MSKGAISERKAAFLILGFLLAFVSVFLMLAEMYEGLIEVLVAMAEGGTYRPYYLRGGPFLLWLLTSVGASVFLALGFAVEGK